MKLIVRRKLKDYAAWKQLVAEASPSHLICDAACGDDSSWAPPPRRSGAVCLNTEIRPWYLARKHGRD